MERYMWRHILSLLLRLLAMLLIIFIPIQVCYELCSLAAPLSNLDRYADIPSILQGAVQSIPRIGNFLDVVVSMLGMDPAPVSSLDFTILEEITYVLLLAFFSPFMYRCYMFFAGLIDHLWSPYFEVLNQLTDAILGAGAVMGGVSLAMILRDTLSLIMRPLGTRSWIVSIAAIIGILLLITIVGSVAARGSLPMKLLCGILSILLGILQAGCIALFANALLLIDNSVYLTDAEVAASYICLVVAAASIFIIIYCYRRIFNADA